MRLWAERTLTLFACVMGGYAWAALFMVLHKQLGPEVSTMLKGSAIFLIVYGWVVHFEPFLAEWRLNGWASAAILYTGVALFAACIGVTIATSMLTSFDVSSLRLLLTTGAVAVGTWIVYKVAPRAEALLERL